MKTKKKIQLVGKVTGLSHDEVVLKFKYAQTTLEAKGYEVVNPTAIIPETTEWKPAMRICIKSLLDVDGIAILPDWNESRGSRLEYSIAYDLGLKIIHL